MHADTEPHLGGEMHYSVGAANDLGNGRRIANVRDHHLTGPCAVTMHIGAQ